MIKFKINNLENTVALMDNLEDYHTIKNWLKENFNITISITEYAMITLNTKVKEMTKHKPMKFYLETNDKKYLELICEIL